MKRLLVNATQEEELRVAMVDGQKLYDLDIEVPSKAQKKANIYKGKITRIEPSLDAAFVNYGADRHGFLPLKEISREYFVKDVEPGDRINIKEVLKEGQDIVVQVDKEERGTKGAALTTFISLAGRFIVLMPNNPRAGGVSRRITGDDREMIRDALRELEIPSGMGVIIRTAGVGRSNEELSWDLTYLLGVWDAIKEAVLSEKSPALIFQDSNAIIRALRDHLATDIGEILIDDAAAFEEAREFMEHAMPHNLRKLKLYDSDVPLFTRFQIESQIESAFSHKVELPSGGSIVIDHTEALVSIDINSARATKGGDIEATALATNLEAADEIARQCRLRDLGGLLVVDFIDMGPPKNQRSVEDRLRDAMRPDRARVQLGRISRFGLLEMSRQRLRPSLGESSGEVCPRCNGMGNIRGVESLALALLRLVGEEVRKERTARVIAQLPVDVANYLHNEKRDWVKSIEERDDCQIILIADPSLETPSYSIRRVRDDQVILPENTGASYALTNPPDDLDEASLNLTTRTTVAETPAVSGMRPDSPAPTPIAKPAEPTPAEPTQPGLVVRLWRALFGTGTAEPVAEKPAKKSSGNGTPSGNRRRPSGDRSRSTGNNQNRNRGRRGRGRRGRDENAAQGKKPDSDQRRQNSSRNRAEPKDNDEAGADRATASAGGNQSPSGRPKRRRRRGGNRDAKGAGNGQSGGHKSDRQDQDGNKAEPPAPNASEQNAQPQGKQPTNPSSDRSAKATNPDQEKRPEHQASGSVSQSPPGGPSGISAGSASSAQAPATASQPDKQAPAKPVASGGTASAAAASASPAKTSGGGGSTTGAEDRKEPAASRTQPAQERLLPWEKTPGDGSTKTYKSWSSGDGDTPDSRRED